MGLVRALCGVFAFVMLALPALQAQAMVCWPIANAQPRLMLAALQPEEVGLTFLGHASFLLESPKGVTIVTDYNGRIEVTSQQGSGTSVNVRLPAAAAAFDDGRPEQSRGPAVTA